MEVLTFYAGQGAFGVVRHIDEAIVVDSRICDSVIGSRAEMIADLDRILRGLRIPGLILTGFDCDHATPDGVDLILSRYQPDWIMYPGYYKESDNAAAVVRTVRKHEQRRQFDPRPLRRLSVRVDRVESRVLNGLSKRFQYELFSPHIEDMSNSNCCSIVLKLTGVGPGGFSYLITGDTENSRWERINKIFGASLKSDVLAAPHHGSKNAANPATMLLVQPNTVLISAGVDNQYGHPDAHAVHAYAKVARHVFSTNVQGGVSLFTKPNGFDFDTQLFK